MKPFNQIFRNRRGLSIIEVLTSVVVAMIGVFGVMVLIPFAIKQAQVGLDKDAAVILARNAYSDFEINGYRLPTNWGLYRGAPVNDITPYSPFDGADGPQVFSIDPLGYLENFDGTNMLEAFNKAYFPFNAGPAGAQLYPSGTGWVDLRIVPVTLGTAGGAPISLAAARRVFATSDELTFGEAADDLLGPEQVFDIAPNGAGALVPARRQRSGRLSWSAIVVPFKDDPVLGGTQRWSYQMHILVYKDRQLFVTDPPHLVPPVTANPASSEQMIYARVNPGTTGSSGFNSPLTNVQLDPSVLTVEGAVERDDWVMLINQARTPADAPAGLAEFGFHRQLAFYRVVNVADSDGTNPVMLTLDGPDFRFDDGSGAMSDTYIVHLKNVAGVYQRTFEPEFESIWTTRGN